jgi:hypothetical protein
MEDMGSNAAAERDIWGYFNAESIRYVEAVDSCPMEFGSPEVLLRRLDQRRDAWLIVSEESVNRFSEKFVLQKAFDVSPLPRSAPRWRLALYLVNPKPARDASRQSIDSLEHE